MQLNALLNALKILVSLVFLTYASWRDYKTREVSNRVWILYAPVALILSLVDFGLYDSSNLPFFGLSFGVTTVVALVLFYSGGFGGADSKALMCIALALPFLPELTSTPIISSGISPLSQIVFPLTIFGNAALLAAGSGLYLLFHNIIWHIKNKREFFEGSLSNESIGKKIVVIITGYRTSVNKIEDKWHIYPLENVVDEGENLLKRNLVVVPKEEGRDEIIQHLSDAVKAGKISDYLWATPGLPMLIFITIGLIAALVFGDLVWILVSFVLG